MMRFLSFLLLLLLMTGCSRYTIGAANSAPRVVSGQAEVTTVSEASDHAAETSEEADHAEAAHSVSVPEIENALVVAREAFAQVRGSSTARHEAAQALEAARAALGAVAETGAISHWETLDEHFEVATEKVLEGTNDAPNALNRLLEHLKEAGQH